MPKNNAAGVRFDSAAVRLKGAELSGLGRFDLDIPHGKLNLLIGPSGSGKTTLAIDTICAESSRRLGLGFEELQVFGGRGREFQSVPKFDELSGLLPCIDVLGVAEKLAGGGEKSVGDMLRLYALLAEFVEPFGEPKCQTGSRGGSCDMQRASVEGVCREVIETNPSEPVLIGAFFPSAFLMQHRQQSSAPAVRCIQDAILELILEYQQMGRRRFVLGGELHTLPSVAEKSLLEEAGGDALKKDQSRSRLVSSIESLDALQAEFTVVTESLSPGRMNFDSLSSALAQAMQSGSGVAALYQLNKDRSAVGRKWIAAGGYYCSRCEKIYPKLDKRMLVKENFYVPEQQSEDAVSLKLFGKRLWELAESPILDLKKIVEKADFERLGSANSHAAALRGNLLEIIEICMALGLERLSLNRRLRHLSSGERVKLLLAMYFSSGVSDCMFILGEASRLLHPRDMQQLLAVCRGLVQKGNTVLLLERDGAGIAADNTISLGPLSASDTDSVCPPDKKRVSKAGSRGLKKLVVDLDSGEKPAVLNIPLNSLVVLVGVSGSGKTRLMRDIIYKQFRESRKRVKPEKSSSEAITRAKTLNFGGLKRVLFDEGGIVSERSTRERCIWETADIDLFIADLFAAQAQARRIGLGPDCFSLRNTGGRCEHCLGTGAVSLDLTVMGQSLEICSNCQGARFDTLARTVLYAGRSISDVLLLDVEEAVKVFANHSEIVQVFLTLLELGLGHLRLGQSLCSLPKHEGQLIYLAQVLAREKAEKSLLMLENPFSCLNLGRIISGMNKLRGFIEQGGSVLLSSFQSEVIKQSDFVIELSADGFEKFSGQSEGFALDSLCDLGEYAPPIFF